MPAVLDILLSFLRGMVGVLSLTERSENLVMWAHYAAQHHGFVIGFNSEHPWFETSDEFRTNVLAKIRYVKERPAKGLKTITLDDTYFTKSQDWSHEEEWRVYRLLSLADQRIIASDEPVHLFCFPPSLITKVIIGCRATTDTRRVLLEILNADEYRHATIKNVRLDKI
jgi:Protein of unknown function (DUF2971)